MARYDGIHVPVSHLLGTGFKPRFLSRFCVPLMCDGTVDGLPAGFDAAPRPRFIPRHQVMESDEGVSGPARVPIRSAVGHGFYRLRYILEPRVAVHPRAFIEPVANDGPYELNNMWSTKSFHHSVL